MAKADDFDKKLGLAMPMKEAKKRFSEAVQAHPDEIAENLPGIVDGELDLVPFGKEQIRRVYHAGEWWFSVVDVMSALTGSQRPVKYWADLRNKLIEKEGFSDLSDLIGQLPMPGADGKMYRSDVVATETLLRLIQAVPSPKAEPFKRWLARVGYERIQESQDPEIAIKRAILTYQIQGRTDDWIEKRIRSIVARKELTNEWKERGIQEGQEYAILTNIISERTFGMHTNNHKKVKGLSTRNNLRDHMTDLELILTMLGETSTKEIARRRDAQGFDENERAASAGGSIAGQARKQIENETGERVVSNKNFLGQNQRVADPQRLSLPKKS